VSLVVSTAAVVGSSTWTALVNRLPAVLVAVAVAVIALLHARRPEGEPKILDIVIGAAEAGGSGGRKRYRPGYRRSSVQTEETR
jgi:hypothetical protein